MVRKQKKNILLKELRVMNALEVIFEMKIEKRMRKNGVFFLSTRNEFTFLMIKGQLICYFSCLLEVNK